MLLHVLFWLTRQCSIVMAESDKACVSCLQDSARFREAGVQVPTPVHNASQARQEADGASSSTANTAKAAEQHARKPCDVSASPIKVCHALWLH